MLGNTYFLSLIYTSNLYKELGAASQPFPATVTSERLGSGISETLVTRDALDKYQIVAEKVVHILFSIFSPPFFNPSILVLLCCIVLKARLRCA